MAETPVEFGAAPRVADDGRLDAPAFHRNHGPIWQALSALLQDRDGEVLEAGSGTGQHVVYFAQQSPRTTWWPSDYGEAQLRSIEAWRTQSGLPNIRPPLQLDLADPVWSPAMRDGNGPGPLLAVFCANVIHISPWNVAKGLFVGAASYLRPDGYLVLYGPFQRDGEHTAPSNAAFDASLRASNPEWGVRDLAEVEALAQSVGLILRNSIEMPANNLVLVFARA
uniref:SAM-dependent methyltransferase n=1 Tax=Rhodopseudomonas palustris (strain BisA53) TaxID=316055 RepID=Q07U95_RHOP5